MFSKTEKPVEVKPETVSKSAFKKDKLYMLKYNGIDNIIGNKIYPNKTVRILSKIDALFSFVFIL